MVLIGQKIRKLRENRNFSQEYVAECLGISQTAYSKIENDQTKLTAERITKLSQLFNIPENEFFSFDQHIEFHNNTITNGYVNSIIQTQKEVYESTIETLQQQINQLNTERNKLLEILADKL